MTDKIVYLVQENPYISVLAAEEYGKIVDDGDDTQHSVNHDWQNMYPEKKDLSDIPEGSIGGGKKKKSRKKSSQKKRKKSKKRTKRRVKK